MERGRAVFMGLLATVGFCLFLFDTRAPLFCRAVRARWWGNLWTAFNRSPLRRHQFSRWLQPGHCLNAVRHPRWGSYRRDYRRSSPQTKGWPQDFGRFLCLAGSKPFARAGKFFSAILSPQTRRAGPDRWHDRVLGGKSGPPLGGDAYRADVGNQP